MRQGMVGNLLPIDPWGVPGNKSDAFFYRDDQIDGQLGELIPDATLRSPRSFGRPQP